MQQQNQIMLLTYCNSLGRNIGELHHILGRYFEGAIGGIHLLPFYPSSGDRGFVPMGYRHVDPAYGDWDDIRALAGDYTLMFDFVLNHLSVKSKYFKDFLQYKDQSYYRNLFIRCKDFWQDGEQSGQEASLVLLSPHKPYTMARFDDGSREEVWSTLGEGVVDLNCESEAGLRFIAGNLSFLADMGAKAICLNQVSFAIKRPGTNCFFVEPEVWGLLEFCENVLAHKGVTVLPEVSGPYPLKQKVAAHGHCVYDTALPMLLLHALYYGNSGYLKQWLAACPHKQYTTLDTHDGINATGAYGLLPDEELAKTKRQLLRYGLGLTSKAQREAYTKHSAFALNCTYYSALGDDDDAYLLARAVQFFAPGTPQVYYMGLLAGKNDHGLHELTKKGRDLNRHSYTEDQIDSEVGRPVVQRLRSLMRFRNEHPAFSGSVEVLQSDNHSLHIRRVNKTHVAQLEVDFAHKTFSIRCTSMHGNTIRELHSVCGY